MRRSPPGMPHKEEDWPALTPQKIYQQENPPALSCTVPSLPLPKERYPTFSNVSYEVPSQDYKAFTTAKSAQPIQLKGVPPVEPLETPSKPDNVASVEKVTSYYHETNMNTAILPVGPSTVNKSMTHSDLSASAAAVEKSAYEAGSIGQPRQTRTSSLRARLSTGQLIRDSPITKPRVVGFTDFTVFNESSTEPSIQALRAPAVKPNRSISPHDRQIYGAGLSKESLHGTNQAPAQLVGGSQIPILRHHSSRLSLRGERRALSPFFLPQSSEQTNPTISISSEASRAASPIRSDARKVSEPRRSSIPVFRHTVSSMLSQAENEKAMPSGCKNTNLRDCKNSSKEFGIFESCASESWPEVPVDSADPNDEGRSSDVHENVKTSQHVAGLEAIEESPKQDFHIKRLSLASPELGPTLKIAKSADRVIMGSGSDKENQQESKLKNSLSQRRAFSKSNSQQTIQGLESAKTLIKNSKRPSTSQGLPASSRTGLVSKEVRGRKAKSADLCESLSTNHLRPQSIESKSQFRHINSKVSLMDDPFFDARSHNEQDKTASEASTVFETKHASSNQSVDEEPWISPMFNNQDHSSGSKADPVSAEKAVASHESPDDEPIAEKHHSASVNLPNESIEVIHEQSKIPLYYKKAITVQIPSTPQKELRQFGSSKSSSFPPRSSSHAITPDYTLDGSSTKSSVSPLAIKNSENFLARQNKLGTSKGFPSAQLEFGDGLFKRESAAQESFKSQGSLTKGMLSNFRGLFHKRSPDQGLLSSYRLNKKSKPKVSIGANESPFPPASEIHPIYRPTLCSKNRSTAHLRNSALNNNIKTPTTPSFASPMPSDISTTTSLALQLFESVRTESSSPKKERTLEMGTILVEAITQAREAEKAVGEAKIAARKAETAHAMCKKSVADITSRVQEWKDEMDRMQRN